MKSYECTFIINPDKEEETEEIIDRIKTKIKDENGKVKEVDEWGIKKLAYDISGYNRGFYVIMNFDIELEKVEVLEDYLGRQRDLLRYLIVVEGK